MEQTESPQFITELAIEFHNLMVEFQAIERVRQMVLEWDKDFRRRKSETADWHDQRRAFYENTVAKDKRLRDRQNCPHPQHIWVSFTYWDGTKRRRAQGWFPEEFTSTAEPIADLPLPLKVGVSRTDPERYALLAAIHDEAWKGELVNPFAQRDSSMSSRTQAELIKAEIDYATLRIRVKDIPKEDKPFLRDDFTHIQRQLVARKRTDDDGESAGTGLSSGIGARRRGRKKADYNTQQKEFRMADDWARAREAGVAMVDFVSDQTPPLKLNEFRALLDRVRKQRERADKLARTTY